MKTTHQLAAELAALQGQTADCVLPVAQALLQAAQREGHPGALREASTVIGVCLLQEREFGQARQWFQRSLDICRLHRDNGAEAGIRGQLGLIHLLQGHYELALEQFQAGRRLGAARRDEQLLGLLHNLAVVLHRLERYDDAVETCQETLQLGRELGFGAREEAHCRLNMARSLERAERLDEAERVCREAFRGLQETGSSSLVAFCQALQANVALRRGSGTMAVLLAREATLSLGEEAPEEARLEVLQILGRCEAQVGEVARAEEVLRAAVEIARRRNLHLAAVDCCEQLGRLLAARGEWAEALAWQERALEQHRLHHDREMAGQRAQAAARLQEQHSGWRGLLTEGENLPNLTGLGDDGDEVPLPICSCCRKVREDANRWAPLENYLLESHGLLLSHGLCPDCATGMYQDLLESTQSVG
ncbi:MAG: tetratricopeptide repeat protein [Candidatus Delongbacteria bacterium]